ncbi:MAG: phosphopantothenoylcysteine decarboxylase / phosphopantothenate---cysteine ligase [Thermomicrobiales bacterium]|jgi:phosphopantothenoylcysteine decarboxylase/phosphopantothenate--cysteine ligase|nr:phosphopantothenoylcysteine decarboxylase / phosphopantothenate---cysteine ligase [Thermomicrobiales bacterium]
MTVLEGARLLLAVTGGIAAYKSADLASKLVQAGAVVDVVLSETARRFIGAATFEALTKRPVRGDVFEPWTETSYGHITLGHDADAIVVSPATAHTIARLAHGFADDMLGAAVLSTTAPLIVVPAMEHLMYHHPATQANLATLRTRGAVQVGPERGRLASGEEGDGRLAPTEAILGAIRLTLGRSGPLAGRRVVVSAGGTQEPLDPVRFIGNRSSGLMGYALAQAAIDAGARVNLVSGQTHLAAPYGAELTTVTTAMEMFEAIRCRTCDADALIMAAAVADFRPGLAATSKIKKSEREGAPGIDLIRNPDIVASIDKPGLVKIGFAAETDDLIDNARKKIAAKGLAMIVANDATATIGSRSSTAVLLTPDGRTETLPTLPKEKLAAIIVSRLASILGESHRAETD